MSTRSASTLSVEFTSFYRRKIRTFTITYFRVKYNQELAETNIYYEPESRPRQKTESTRRPRQWKRHQTSKVVQFIKCRHIFLKSNFHGLYKSKFKKRKENSSSSITSSTKRCIGTGFLSQSCCGRQRIVPTKSARDGRPVMFFFTHKINLFSRSRCCRCRGCPLSVIRSFFHGSLRSSLLRRWSFLIFFLATRIPLLKFSKMPFALFVGTSNLHSVLCVLIDL